MHLWLEAINTVYKHTVTMELNIVVLFILKVENIWK